MLLLLMDLPTLFTHSLQKLPANHLRNVNVCDTPGSGLVVDLEYPSLHEGVSVDQIGQLVQQVGLSVYIN